MRLETFEYSLSDVKKKEKATNAFILAYEETFNVTLSGCTGCNIERYYRELMNYINHGKMIDKINLRVKRRYQEKIFTFKRIEEGKKPRNVRRFGNNMTLEFAKDFLKFSTKEEMKHFASHFDKLIIDDYNWTDDVEVKEEKPTDVIDITVGNSPDVKTEGDAPVDGGDAPVDDVPKEFDFTDILKVNAIEATKILKEGEFSKEFLEALLVADERKGIHTVINNLLGNE